MLKVRLLLKSLPHIEEKNPPIFIYKLYNIRSPSPNNNQIMGRGRNYKVLIGRVQVNNDSSMMK
jgi:hypothetical protein